MRIYPLRTGIIKCNRSVITLGRGYDQWIDIPVTAWFIETGKNNILVDTGMCDTERASTYHYPGSTQKDNERIDHALRSIGISINDIDTVIMTHLHWDHCSNCELFEGADLIVQKEELNFALRPIPTYYSSYEANEIGLKAGFRSVNFKVIEGDYDVVSGVKAMFTPGHSHGHQSVLVKAEKQDYIVSGDAILSYDNLERDSIRRSDFTMIGRYMDAGATWSSYKKIVETGGFILPSHDFRVFDREYYD